MDILYTELKREKYYSSISDIIARVCSGLQAENLHNTFSEISGRTNLTQFLKAKFRFLTQPVVSSVPTEVSFKYASVIMCALKAFYTYKESASSLRKQINLLL